MFTENSRVYASFWICNPTSGSHLTNEYLFSLASVQRIHCWESHEHASNFIFPDGGSLVMAALVCC
jgi:hypothetical protein